jgi:hypothetical protein
MKIYILPVSEELQPSSTEVIYPPHNDDYGLEQDFLKYLQLNEGILIQNVDKADFHYLPVFWTRWKLNHLYNKNVELEFIYNVKQTILDDSKTFTISHVPKHTLLNDLGKTIIFSAARNSDDVLDAPLICKPHRLPTQISKIQYLVSFSGKVHTHPIRQAMVDCFTNLSNSYIYAGHLDINSYVEKILESLVVLCPRGNGGNSFRFYETMQLGRVPFLIGDLDTRPFKKYIDWDQCSFYATSPQEALDMVQNCSRERLTSMGRTAAAIWRDELNFGKWCPYVLKELSGLNSR